MLWSIGLRSLWIVGWEDDVVEKIGCSLSVVSKEAMRSVQFGGKKGDLPRMGRAHV